MATSQFKVFSSGDIGAPQLDGLSGSLINVLTWCLISGSGWLQPSASVNLVPTVPTIGIYQQPSASKCILYINDASPNVTSVGREAWAIGWENLTTMSAPCGTGSNQFPLPAQLLTTGHYVVRKSSTATNVPRNWTMYVDPYTFYLFTLPEDTHTYYSTLFFGDFYSPVPNIDTNRCFIWARTVENQGAATVGEQTDVMTFPLAVGTVGGGNGTSGIAARSVNGFPSTWIGRLGDVTKTGETYFGTNYHELVGNMNINVFQNDLIIVPLLVSENASLSTNVGIRGKYRGMYYLPYWAQLFYDGQTLSGSNELYGKVFQIVKPGPNSGFWAIEISPTVDTN